MSFPGCGRTVAMEKLKNKGIDSEYIDVDVFRCRKEKDKTIFIDLFPYNLNEYIKEAYYKNRYLFISLRKFCIRTNLSELRVDYCR